MAAASEQEAVFRRHGRRCSRETRDYGRRQRDGRRDGRGVGGKYGNNVGGGGGAASQRDREDGRGWSRPTDWSRIPIVEYPPWPEPEPGPL